MKISKEQLRQFLLWEVGKIVHYKKIRIFDFENPVEEKDVNMIYDLVDEIVGQADEKRLCYNKLPDKKEFIELLTYNDGERIIITF